MAFRAKEVYLDINIKVLNVGEEAPDGHLITGDSELDFGKARLALDEQWEVDQSVPKVVEDEIK